MNLTLMTIRRQIEHMGTPSDLETILLDLVDYIISTEKDEETCQVISNLTTAVDNLDEKVHNVQNDLEFQVEEVASTVSLIPHDVDPDNVIVINGEEKVIKRLELKRRKVT